MQEPNKGRDVWMMVLFALLLVAGIAMVGAGAYIAVTQRHFEVLALGLLSVMVPASAYALAGRDSDPLVILKHFGPGNPDAPKRA